MSIEISVELALLSVELILLTATLILLGLSRREERGREGLVKHLLETTRILSRQDYFHSVIGGLSRAKGDVSALVTGTRPSGGDLEIVEKMMDQIRETVSRGVRIRYLIPETVDRIQMGYRYHELGSEVRYHRGLIVHDLRYMIVDGEIVVIGLPEKTGEEQPTRKGFSIRSESLARILKEEFDKLWLSDKAMSYEDFLRESINHLRETNPGISLELVAKHIDIDYKEISKYFKQ